MKELPFLLALFLALLVLDPITLCAQSDLTDLSIRALSSDPAIAQSAQDELRTHGPEGLQALGTRADQIISKGGESTIATQAILKTAFNRVGAQYDNDISRLYWYNDLEKAKAAAKATGRPILSLHLLGRLDEDLSCANSRFFRTTLYPQAIVNTLLRDKFILHWESVRPVPRITIDFGDGRKLERTITGNSIHYILDADGKIIDALPGLYSAPVFARELQQDVTDYASLKPADYPVHLKAIQDRIEEAWIHDLLAIGVPSGMKTPLNKLSLAQDTTEARWQQIAQLHVGEATLDESARTVIARKFPTAATAAPLAISKRLVESPLLVAIRNLQSSIALDTVRNNYLLRDKILDYLGSVDGQAQSLASINNWVYSQVFLTPKEDPWLGLAPADVFSAIDHNGEH